MTKVNEFVILLIEANTRYEETEDWVLDRTDPSEVKEYNGYKLEEHKAYLKLLNYVLNNSDSLKQQLMELIPKD